MCGGSVDGDYDGIFTYVNNDEESSGDVIYGYSMARHLKQLEYQSSIESSEIYDSKPHLDDIDMPIPQQMNFSVLNLISDNHENYIDKLTYSNSMSRTSRDLIDIYHLSRWYIFSINNRNLL